MENNPALIFRCQVISVFEKKCLNERKKRVLVDEQRSQHGLLRQIGMPSTNRAVAGNRFISGCVPSVCLVPRPSAGLLLCHFFASSIFILYLFVSLSLSAYDCPSASSLLLHPIFSLSFFLFSLIFPSLFPLPSHSQIPHHPSLSPFHPSRRLVYFSLPFVQNIFRLGSQRPRAEKRNYCPSLTDIMAHFTL